MPIIINLDILLVKKKIKSKNLAKKIDITEQNLSVLKTGKAKAIRFSTLEALCSCLKCQPGDILLYHPEERASDDACEF
jgi:putative transcriptional regulator